MYNVALYSTVYFNFKLSDFLSKVIIFVDEIKIKKLKDFSYFTKYYLLHIQWEIQWKILPKRDKSEHCIYKK